MPTVQDVETKIDDMIELATQTFKQESETHYQEFQTLIFDLEGLARETFQAKVGDLFWPVLTKLEQGNVLTTAEYNILEMLMVGEAKYYLRSEINVDLWRAELKRLTEEIEKQRAAGLDEIDGLMTLRALCREAMRIIPDLAYYFREKERVRRFEDVTSGAIDVEARRLLANLIKEMIESDQL